MTRITINNLQVEVEQRLLLNVWSKAAREAAIAKRRNKPSYAKMKKATEQRSVALGRKVASQTDKWWQEHRIRNTPRDR